MSSSEQSAGTPSAHQDPNGNGDPAGPAMHGDQVPHYRALGQAIELFVEQRGPQLGGTLSTWLRGRHEFDPKSAGFANLSAFLSTYAPKLERISRAGADVIWGFQEQAGDAAVQEPLPHRLWRALASPNSGRSVELFVHTGTGEWRIEKAPSAGPSIPSGAAGSQSPIGEWKRILPLSAAAHREMAEKFLQRSDVEPIKQILETALNQKVWWMPWMQALSGHPSLMQSWYATREEALRQHIRNSLEAAGVEESRLDEAAAHPVPGAPNRLPGDQNRGHSGGERSLTERSIRELVLAVVACMDDGQLRELRLPAGAVLDALGRS